MSRFKSRIWFSTHETSTWWLINFVCELKRLIRQDSTGYQMKIQILLYKCEWSIVNGENRGGGGAGQVGNGIRVTKWGPPTNHRPRVCRRRRLTSTPLSLSPLPRKSPPKKKKPATASTPRACFLHLRRARRWCSPGSSSSSLPPRCRSLPSLRAPSASARGSARRSRRRRRAAAPACGRRSTGRPPTRLWRPRTSRVSEREAERYVASWMES